MCIIILVIIIWYFFIVYIGTICEKPIKPQVWGSRPIYKGVNLINLPLSASLRGATYDSITKVPIIAYIYDVDDNSVKQIKIKVYTTMFPFKKPENSAYQGDIDYNGIKYSVYHERNI